MPGFFENSKLTLTYLAVISVVSVIVTIYDKIAAKHGKRRIRESVLLLLAVLGGSVFMLLSMLIIRHKTLHMKFMLGIPLIIVLQAVIAAFLIQKGLII